MTYIGAGGAVFALPAFPVHVGDGKWLAPGTIRGTAGDRLLRWAVRWPGAALAETAGDVPDGHFC